MKGIYLVLLIVTLFMTSCMRRVISGQGEQISETRTVTSFNAIELNAPIDAVIEVKEGATSSLQLSGYGNLIKYIKTEVKDNTLRVYIPEGSDLSTDQKVKVIITVPSCFSLVLNGTTDADVHGNLTGNDFTMTVSGASDVDIDNLSVSKFTTNISGAAKVKIKGGHTQVAHYELSGASRVYAFNLITSETYTELSGAGEVNVNVQNKLDVQISGVGTVRYKGHPAITSEKSGIGALVDSN